MKVETEHDAVLEGIAKHLRLYGIYAKVEEHTNLKGTYRIIDCAYGYGNHNVNCTVSVYDGEIRTTYARFPLASPTCFDDLVAHFENGGT